VPPAPRTSTSGTSYSKRGCERPVWGIAVSDAHDGFSAGGWTVVKTNEVSLPALRDALVRGAHYVSTGESSP
jgi:hypothetical protein